MYRLVMYTVFNSAVVGGVGYAQYNLVDFDGIFQKGSHTTRTAGMASRGIRGTRMGRSGSRSRHK